MKVDRYIRAYHKESEQLAFEIKLPSDSLTFLSTLSFLENDNDPLLYCVYELTDRQTDIISFNFFYHNIADPDYFDYFLECDSVPQNKVKIKEQLFDSNLISTLKIRIYLLYMMNNFFRC